MRKYPDLMTMLHMSGFCVIFRGLIILEWIEREREKFGKVHSINGVLCSVLFGGENTYYLGCNCLYTLISKHKDTPVKN